MKTILSRIIITWMLFIPVPVINGLLREKWYKAITGETIAHQIGTAVVSLFFLLYAFISLKGNIGSLSNGQLWGIGLIWLTMTLLFEFGIGIAAGRSWNYMLADYKIWEGRIWPIVLIVVLFSPLIVKLIVSK